MVSSACDWGFEMDGLCPAFDSMTPEQQADAIAVATDFLWNWTDRVFGICEVSVRPCRSGCAKGTTWNGSGPGASWANGKILPVLIGGAWYNLGCGDCGRGDECSCTSIASLSLPGPVASIVEIRIDGEVLPPETYGVQNGTYLIRKDGGSWPTCQNMAADPATAEDTFEITYRRGVVIPAGGRLAAQKLTCEFAKWIVKPSSCDLPQRIKNITREGVQVTLMDDMKDLEGGKTGIWIIDSWVNSVTKPRRASSVRSVDIPRSRFRTDT